MALAFIENVEVNLEPSRQFPADAAPFPALRGFSEQRSFLLDDIVHVAYIWTSLHDHGDVFTVSALRSFSERTGEEIADWTVLGSFHHANNAKKGFYVQTEVRPTTSTGRRDMSAVRIFDDTDAAALFAQPQAHYRVMERVELSPDFLANINQDVVQHSGHLALAT